MSRPPLLDGILLRRPRVMGTPRPAMGTSDHGSTRVAATANLRPTRRGDKPTVRHMASGVKTLVSRQPPRCRAPPRRGDTAGVAAMRRSCRGDGRGVVRRGASPRRVERRRDMRVIPTLGTVARPTPPFL